MSPSFLSQAHRAVSRMNTKDEREGEEYSPGLDEVADGAEDAEQDEQTRGGDVRPAEEWVLPADPRHGRDDDGLGALVRPHGEVCEGDGREERRASVSVSSKGDKSTAS